MNSEITTSTPRLSDELRDIVAPAYKVRALLQGAMALLDEAEALSDPDGHLWSARELVEEAWKKVEEVYSDKDCSLYLRLHAIDEAAAA